jgi:hypothetical protein
LVFYSDLLPRAGVVPILFCPTTRSQTKKYFSHVLQQSNLSQTLNGKTLAKKLTALASNKYFAQFYLPMKNR